MRTMRTDSYNWFFCVTLVLGLLSLVVTSGCGPTRKQYAINEALLIDQAKLLEDEIYRTRYELHKILSENQLLKEELTKNTGHSGGSRRSRENREPAPASSTIPFEPVAPPTPETAVKVNAPQKILVIPTGGSKPSMVEPLPAAVVVPRSVMNVPLGNIVPPIYQPSEANSSTSRQMSYLEEKSQTITKIDSDWSPLE